MFFSLTCVSACMPLQVKSVVESFPAKGAKVPLSVGVTLHVTVEKALQAEGFVA